jgi:topoisomerase IA-like protein
MSKRAVHKATRHIAHKVGCHKDIEQKTTGSDIPFKALVHLGILRGKLKRGELSMDQVASLLAEGQNGGGPNRKERRRLARAAAAAVKVAA